MYRYRTIFINPPAHVQDYSSQSVCVCVCMCVCLSVTALGSIGVLLGGPEGAQASSLFLIPLLWKSISITNLRLYLSKIKICAQKHVQNAPDSIFEHSYNY